MSSLPVPLLDDAGPEPVSPPTADAPQAALLSSRSLLGTATELRIQHGAEFYRLRVTRNGKLILTK